MLQFRVVRTFDSVCFPIYWYPAILCNSFIYNYNVNCCVYGYEYSY